MSWNTAERAKAQREAALEFYNAHVAFTVATAALNVAKREHEAATERLAKAESAFCKAGRVSIGSAEKPEVTSIAQDYLIAGVVVANYGSVPTFRKVEEIK